MDNFMEFLNGQMPTPTIFGWFHLLFLTITIALSVLVVVKARKTSDKTDRIILLTFSITCIVLEIYKQLNFTYTNGWKYQWYAFPFQFCSTPFYIALLAGIFNKGKFNEALRMFLGTFGLFAGLVVMLYPGDVFISTIGINIQTMICHGGMVVIGLYCLTNERTKLTFKKFLSGVLVFASLLSIALLLNVVVYNSGVLNGATFNMFFISPYFECTLPVLNLFQGLPYPIFLMIYLLGFSLAAFIIFIIAFAIKKLINKKKDNKAIKEDVALVKEDITLTKDDNN